MRLTKENIARILEKNEGVTESTYYESRNRRNENIYSIENGKLMIQSIGKTSWADSKYDNTYEADIDQTRRFIRNFKNALNMDGIN